MDRTQTNFSGNPIHLEILLNALQKGNIRIWNEWRLDNVEELPDLRGIELRGENLTGINMIGADLSGCDLSRANLSTGELSGINLEGSVLIETKFVHASIYAGSLKYANLQGANLDGAALNNSKFSGAILSGAIVRGISTTGWEIDNIKCDYVFLDQDRKIREPEVGVYDIGEFETLYKYSPKIKHIFIDEFTYIDILIMDRVVQEINEQNPEYELKLDCFQARGKPRAEFVIKDIRNATKILDEIKQKHEATKEKLIRKLELENMKAETYRDALLMSLKEPTFLIQQIEMNDYKKIWIEFDEGVGNGNELIAELSELRKVLKENSNSIEQDQAIGKIAEAEQAAKSGDGERVIKNLKSVGKWVLDVSTTLGTNIATELIKRSMGL